MLGRGQRRVRRARLSERRAAPRRHPAPAVSRRDRSHRASRPTASCSRCFASAIWPPRSRRCAGVLAPGGVFGLELVADLPAWKEYRQRVTLKGRRGRAGRPITLIESVRQDAERGLTLFDQEFVEGRGREARRHVHADVPDALGPADGPPAGKGRLRGDRRARRLPRRPLGPPGRGLDSPGDRKA